MANVSFLAPLVGHTVRINRGGPESMEGILLAVNVDYLTVYKEGEGVYYYNAEHLKSVTQDGKDANVINLPGLATPAYVDAIDFAALLSELKYHWIKINRGGPESVEGVLTDSTDEMAILIAKNEVITKFMFHIQSVSVADPKQEDEEGQNNQAAQSDSKSSSRSSRSSSKRRR
jgi:spore coat protein B